VRIESLRILTPACENLLRERAEEKGRDSADSLRSIGDALAVRKAEAIALYDDSSILRGIAAWRWADRMQSHAQVLILYTPASTPAPLGEALVDYVFSELIRVGSLQVIEARVRDEAPGAREAWLRHGVVMFERWQMSRPLGMIPLPILPVRDKYMLAPWQPERQTEIEQVAAAAYRDGVEGIAVPDLQGNRAVENLRKLSADPDNWNADASMIVVDKRSGSPVGYVAVVNSAQDVQIEDLAVHPSHRRRGLARTLLVRAMTIAQRQKHSAVALSVTARNPVCALYHQLAFQQVHCGEVAIWWRDGRHMAWRG
jgi:ribosomal protein S18 acetylase RimI-like enzyme